MQQTEQEGREPRFVLLETIREYGLEALAASGELEATRQAHAAYYFHLAEQAEPELVGPHAATWLDRLGREQDNLRATMQWVLEPAHLQRDPERALRLGQALPEFWGVRGFYREGWAFLEQALKANPGVATVLRARVLKSATEFTLELCEFDQAEALCRESLALSRTLGDTHGIILSLDRLAATGQMKGASYEEGRSQLEESLALARDLGDKEIIAWRVAHLADAICNLGYHHEGQRLFEESVALFRELGNKRGLAYCLLNSALYLIANDGDPTTIHDLLEETRTLYTESGDRVGLGLYYVEAGLAALVEGDPVTARVQEEQSLALLREVGSRWRSIFAIAILARIATRQGDYASFRLSSRRA
jgi:tetratricopeptide (TPR) repeat protein